MEETKLEYKRLINNLHDKSYKDLYSNKEVFLDLVKEMLKVPWANSLQQENLVLVDKQYILSDYEENEADIVYKANVDGKEVIFYVLLEFQSSVDYRMPLRLFFYINEILREHVKNLDKENKKNKKGFSVPAVIPIVLYNSTRKWTVPRYFKDIVNNSGIFGENIVNFKYELFDINHEYTKEELIKNKNITSAIFLLDQKVEPIEFLNRLKAVALEFNNLTASQKMILKHWIRNTVDETIADNAVKILESSKEGVENMVANNAFMIDEMKEKAEKNGEVKLLIKQLTKKFKVFPDEYKIKLNEISEEKIEKLAEDIFDLESIEDLKKYF